MQAIIESGLWRWGWAIAAVAAPSAAVTMGVSSAVSRLVSRRIRHGVRSAIGDELAAAERNLLDAEVRIETARADALKAQARSLEAEAERAAAELRTTELAVELERLRRDHQSLAASLQPRVLSLGQTEAFQVLRGRLHFVYVLVDDSAECALFAAQIAAALRRAGVETRLKEAPPHTRNLGVSVLDEQADNPHLAVTGRLLAQVLAEIGHLSGEILREAPDWARPFRAAPMIRVGRRPPVHATGADD